MATFVEPSPDALIAAFRKETVSVFVVMNLHCRLLSEGYRSVSHSLLTNGRPKELLSKLLPAGREWKHRSVTARQLLRSAAVP